MDFNKKEQQAHYKTRQVIRSCKTPAHMLAAKKMIDNYKKMFRETSKVFYLELELYRKLGIQ